MCMHMDMSLTQRVLACHPRVCSPGCDPMWLSLLPHVLQPATLHGVGACGAGLRQHATWAADLRCARARQAYGSRPAPLSASSRARLHPSQDVPAVVRTNLNETLPRRAAVALGVSASRPGDSGAGVRQHGLTVRLAAAHATPRRYRSPPVPARLLRATPFGLQPGSPLCLDTGQRLRRRSGAGPKSPTPLPLAVQVRGVVRRACRASPRAGGVAGSRVHAQQRRSEHRVAVRSGRRVRGVNYSVSQQAPQPRGGRNLSLVQPSLYLKQLID